MNVPYKAVLHARIMLVDGRMQNELTCLIGRLMLTVLSKEMIRILYFRQIINDVNRLELVNIMKWKQLKQVKLIQHLEVALLGIITSATIRHKL